MVTFYFSVLGSPLFLSLPIHLSLPIITPSASGIPTASMMREIASDDYHDKKREGGGSIPRPISFYACPLPISLWTLAWVSKEMGVICVGKRRCSSPSHRQKRERIKDERERIDRQKALRYGSFSGRRTRVTVDDASSQDSGPGSHADPTKERDYCKAGRVLFSPLRSCLRSVVGGNWPGYPLHFHAWALPPFPPPVPLSLSLDRRGREGGQRPPARQQR